MTTDVPEAREPTLKTILFPTDFSELSYVALPYAQMLARDQGARIHLLHVVECAATAGEAAMYFSGTHFLLDDFIAAAEARLEIERGRFQGLWSPVSVEARVGDPATEIDAYAEEIGADLIVMATHQPGFFERLFHSSVAEGTVREAPCPVLIVPHAWVDAVAQREGDAAGADEAPGAEQPAPA